MNEIVCLIVGSVITLVVMLTGDEKSLCYQIPDLPSGQLMMAVRSGFSFKEAAPLPDCGASTSLMP